MSKRQRVLTEAKSAAPPGLAAGRPETLRRHTLATNSKLILLASGLGMPVALYLLLQGVLMPFVLATIGLAAGIMTLALHQRGQYERAAAGQVYGNLIVGLLLTVADPALADFGLAVALLAPVHASLLARTPIKKRSWMLLVGVVGLAAVGSLGLPLWPEAFRPEFGWIAALSFAVTAIIVSHSANRLNSVFEVYEKAQVNAYRHLIENVQDGVMRFSAAGGVLFVSRSSEALFSCRRYELAGNGLIERIHVLDRPLYMTAFADANQGGRSRMVEVRMRRDDPTGEARAAQYIWIEVALSPVIDPDVPGDRFEVVALFRDVTDRKDHETEMRQARKVAEEASDAKSRFLATIGHELRTPLNAIVGFSEMMSSGVAGDISPAHKEYAELIRQSGHHLLDVVRTLLDMSKLEAGKFEIQADGFQPEALIEPCMSMVGRLAAERNIKVSTDLPKTLPQLVADERACRQILINLLSNAIKFSHEGGEVTVSMKRQGKHLNLSVRDRGIGMGPDALRRIGEPFFQAHEGLTRRYEGTGLGLSIVKGLVDLHDGELRTISAPGEGTTMTVLLPLNGPETKSGETGEIRPLRPEVAAPTMPAWQDEKRKAL